MAEGGGGGCGGCGGCARFGGQQMKLLNAGTADCRKVAEVQRFWDEHPVFDIVIVAPVHSRAARVGGVGRPSSC